jgi:hypothetical protein
MVGIGPKDELEGMMAAQLLAAHSAAMECYRRAMIGEQTFEGRRENLSQANKLSRTYAVSRPVRSSTAVTIRPTATLLTKWQPREHRTHTPSNRVRPCGESLRGQTLIVTAGCQREGRSS